MRTSRVSLGAGMLVAVALASVATAPPARARDLSFDDRFTAQKAIEQVYWSHRIWPDGNPGPKPPLQAVMQDATIAAKVDDALRLSALLDSYWRRPLTGEQLQAEIDRMVRETKAPEMLRELFAALHDDPFLIAECLARPILASRLASLAFAGDERIPGATNGSVPFGAWWREAAPLALEARAIEPPDGGYTVAAMPTGAGCTNDAWELSTLTGGTGLHVPAARQAHTALWTGAEMIVWGGWNGSGVAYANGGMYYPATDSWSNSTLTDGSGTNVPVARYRHTAVWTGTEMIVWGGRTAAGAVLNNGGRYDPAAQVWNLSSLTSASGANVPAARESHTAIWTGTSMIVWGGRNAAGNVLNTGGRYDATPDVWTLSALTNATGSFTPVGRVDHTAVWTNTEMIVWGGRGSAGSGLKTGGRYNPTADSWTNCSLTNGTDSFTPSPRYFHSAVWTGSEMVVWGGAPASNTGGKYRPSTDSWALTSLTNATGTNVPAARQQHTAIWTGSEMIVWGGSTDGDTAVLSTGGRYTPATDIWALSTLTNGTGTNVPSPRQLQTAVWTGASDSRMVVWGGSPNTATGGLYCAVCTPLTWYADVDGDGFGNLGMTQVSCAQPAGFVYLATDCNDGNSAINPGADEACNGLDDNCNTFVDEGENALCPDGNACTADVCLGAGGCAHSPTNLDDTGFSRLRMDGRDLVLFANAYNSCPTQPKYSPAANLDQGTAPAPGSSCINEDDFHLFMTVFGHACTIGAQR